MFCRWCRMFGASGFVFLDIALAIHLLIHWVTRVAKRALMDSARREKQARRYQAHNGRETPAVLVWIVVAAHRMKSVLVGLLAEETKWRAVGRVAFRRLM